MTRRPIPARAPPPAASDPAWLAVRRRYEDTDDAVADILADAGQTRAEFDAVRRRERWRRSKPRGFPPARRAATDTAPEPTPDAQPATKPPTRRSSRSVGASRKRSSRTARTLAPPPPASPEAAASAPSPAPSPPARRRTAKPVTLAGRRKLIDRLVAAISLKLEQLERRMAQDLDAAETGAASSTDHERETRAIGALIDNLGKVTEIASDIERPAGGKSAIAAAELADEADRFRRELAERLSRIVRSAEPRA